MGLIDPQVAEQLPHAYVDGQLGLFSHILPPAKRAAGRKTVLTTAAAASAAEIRTDQQTRDSAGVPIAVARTAQACVIRDSWIWGAIFTGPYLWCIMKTTVEISDALMREVRDLAAREGVTLRTLVERGLHRVIAERKHGAPFKLRRASFKGKGRQVELHDASWERLRDLIYQDRGA